MVHINHEKLAEERRKDFDRMMAYRQKIYRLAEDNKKELLSKGLYVSVIPWGNAGIWHGFRGNSSLERCFFDDGKLMDISGVVTFSSSEGFPRTIYKCKKCKLKYDLPLGKKERREYEKRMEKMVFG